MSVTTVKTPNYVITKVVKASKPSEVKTSRVGVEYQAIVPDLKPEHTLRNVEQHVWDPEKGNNSSEVEKYLQMAKEYYIPDDSSLTLLHWHNYDFEKALADLPNYVHLGNRWNKAEIKRFLKLLDSKSNKDFFTFKKKFPKHSLGELISFYYLSVSCIRSSRVGRRYETLWRNSYTKADRLHLLNKPSDIRQRPNIIGLSPFASIPTNFLPRQNFGSTNDILEYDIESQISKVLGVKKAKRLFHYLFLDRPFPVEELIELRVKEEKNDSNQMNSGSNSEYCSQIETDSTSQKNQNEYSLPNGMLYDHDEFLGFLNDPETMTDDRLTKESLDKMDQKIEAKKKEIDKESLEVLESMKKFKPANGFPKLSYRWTQRELALTLTAISHLGPDFNKISKIVGTKSEALIKDFYNTYNEKYHLDGLYKERKEESSNLTTIKTENESETNTPTSAASPTPLPAPVSHISPTNFTKTNNESKDDSSLSSNATSRPKRNIKPTLKKRLFDNENESSNHSSSGELNKSPSSNTKKQKNRSSFNKGDSGKN